MFHRWFNWRSSGRHSIKGKSLKRGLQSQLSEYCSAQGESIADTKWTSDHREITSLHLGFDATPTEDLVERLQVHSTVDNQIVFELNGESKIQFQSMTETQSPIPSSLASAPGVFETPLQNDIQYRSNMDQAIHQCNLFDRDGSTTYFEHPFVSKRSNSHKQKRIKNNSNFFASCFDLSAQLEDHEIQLAQPFPHPTEKRGQLSQLNQSRLPSQFDSEEKDSQSFSDGIKESISYIATNFGNWIWDTWIEPNFGGPLTPRNTYGYTVCNNGSKFQSVGALRRNVPNQLCERHAQLGGTEKQQIRAEKRAAPICRDDTKQNSTVIHLLKGQNQSIPESLPLRIKRLDGSDGEEGCVTVVAVNDGFRSTVRQQTSDELLMNKTFKTKFWKEKPIIPVKERLPSATFWQKLWHVIDERTLKERQKRHHDKVTRIRHRTITRQKWNDKLIDITKDHWFRACFTHVELTFFSIENAPYIGQIVLDCPYFRVAMPFNCRFMRVPYIGEDQVITVWFNSPVGKTQRCLKTQYEGFVDKQMDWVGSLKAEDKELDELGRVQLDQVPSTICDEDEMTEDELQQISDEIHKQSLYMKLADYGKYNPHHDFPTYFRLDIPMNELLKSEDRTIEDVALIDPNGIFYEVNSESSPGNLFNRLREGARHEQRHPQVKFCAKYYGQGLNNLVTTGDTQYDHPLSLTERERRSGKLIERIVYVAQSGDDLDDSIGSCLNNDIALLKQLDLDSIYRLHNGRYVIHGNEVEIISQTFSGSSISEFDFTHYAYEFSGGIPYQGFILPVVRTPDFWIPLKECLLKSSKNCHWIAVEKKKSTSSLHSINMDPYGTTEELMFQDEGMIEAEKDDHGSELLKESVESLGTTIETKESSHEGKPEGKKNNGKSTNSKRFKNQIKSGIYNVKRFKTQLLTIH